MTGVTRIVDEHNLEVRNAFGRTGRCRAQVFQDGVRFIVLLTQNTAGHDGWSLDNGAEAFADAVRERYLPTGPGRPAFVKRYVDTASVSSWDFDSGQTFFTTFDQKGEPHWRAVDPQTNDLLRRYADPGRGNAYVPPPIPPTSTTSWVKYPVRKLPRPQRLFRASCMKAGPARALNRLAQLLGMRRCDCWYHAGNWRRAVALAVALEQAHTRLPDLDHEIAVGEGSTDLLVTSGFDAWTVAAAQSLLHDPICLDSDLNDYTNGQHRAEALLDQHVKMVPLIVGHKIGTNPPAPVFRRARRADAQSTGLVSRSALRVPPRRVP